MLLTERNGELFLPLAPGQNSKRETLSATIDRINLRYGKTVIKYGQQQEHLGFFDRG
jgi:DNA polymerase-4